MSGTVQTDDQKKEKKPVSHGLGKEAEPATEEQLLSEIVKTTEEQDKAAEKKIRDEIREGRLAQPKVEIHPDVAESGVHSPEVEAEKALIKGFSVTLPLTEDEYNRGLHQKVKGMIVDKVAYGVSSMIAFAIWIGRILKLAPKQEGRVIFEDSKEEKHAG